MKRTISLGLVAVFLSLSAWLRLRAADPSSEVRISTPRLEIRFDHRLHRTIAWRGQGTSSILVDSPEVDDNVDIEGVEINGFEIDPKRTSQGRTVHPEFGPSTEASFVGVRPSRSEGPPLERQTLQGTLQGTEFWNSPPEPVGRPQRSQGIGQASQPKNGCPDPPDPPH